MAMSVAWYLQMLNNGMADSTALAIVLAGVVAMLSWKLALKANALYRDGSKLSQPLNSALIEDNDNDDADGVEELVAQQLHAHRGHFAELDRRVAIVSQGLITGGKNVESVTGLMK